MIAGIAMLALLLFVRLVDTAVVRGSHMTNSWTGTADSQVMRRFDSSRRAVVPSYHM